MDKFINLDNHKQDNLINSALVSFGNTGYKKTSINDIATISGISKALVFHYFGNKKSLYLFLFDYCSAMISNSIKAKFNNSETDFFKKIKLIQTIKFDTIKKHPSMFDFLKCAYFESDQEVAADIKAIHQKYVSGGFSTIFTNTNFSKFKEDVDPKMVMKIITWCAEGYVSELSKIKELNVEATAQEFDVYLELLKNSFYKEEYL